MRVFICIVLGLIVLGEEFAASGGCEILALPPQADTWRKGLLFVTRYFVHKLR